jgi:hypothetical protein
MQREVDSGIKFGKGHWTLDFDMSWIRRIVRNGTMCLCRFRLGNGEDRLPAKNCNISSLHTQCILYSTFVVLATNFTVHRAHPTVLQPCHKTPLQ